MIDATQRTVGIVLAAVLVAAGCGGSGGDVDAGEDPEALAQDRSSDSTERVPSSAEIRTAVQVVEKGFSLGQGSVSPDPVLTYGVVLENTSEYVVQGLAVTVIARDAAGAHVYRRMDAPKRITRLLPGERLGFGQMTYLGTTTDIAEIHVELSDPEAWDKPENVDPALLGTFSVEGVSASAGANGEPVVQFTAASTFDPPASPYAYAVFRDAAGKIVGGASHNVGPLAPGQPRPATIPGAITITDYLYEQDGVLAIAAADLARTEVFLSTDLLF